MLHLHMNVLENEVVVLRANLVAAVDHIRREEFTLKSANPTVARQKSFVQIKKMLSPKQFHRMFQMNIYSLLERLCDCIVAKVGANFFTQRSGWFLADQARSTNRATSHATSALGGTLSGEMKVGMTIASTYPDWSNLS